MFRYIALIPILNPGLVQTWYPVSNYMITNLILFFLSACFIIHLIFTMLLKCTETLLYHSPYHRFCMCLMLM